MGSTGDTQIRIVIATGIYPPEIGGPATYTQMLEAHLPAHGIAFHVVPYGWVRGYPKLFRHLVYTWRLFKSTADCTVIYALDPVSVGVPARIVAWLRRKPLMLRIAGDYAWEQGQQRFGVTDVLDDFVLRNRSYGPVVGLLSRIQRFVARGAVRIVVPSEYMKGVIAKWGIPEERITRVYSALHPIAVTDTRDALRAQLEYEGLVIVSAARLTPWKGMQRLIDALAIVRKDHPDATLVIVGDGSERASLEEHAVESGLYDAVRFVGRQSKDSLGAAIKAADVFVLNTAYEGLSHQLLEVMDIGVPVVTTPVGGNVELIEHGVNGLLVPHNDAHAIASAVVRAATHEQLRNSLVQNARHTTQHFNEKKVVDDFVTVLRDVVSTNVS